MRVTIENCEPGYVLEVQLNHADPNFLVMQGHTDFKKVLMTWPEVEKFLRELFMGKNFQTVVTHVMEE